MKDENTTSIKEEMKAGLKILKKLMIFPIVYFMGQGIGYNILDVSSNYIARDKNNMTIKIIVSENKLQKGYLVPEQLKIRNFDKSDSKQEMYITIKGTDYALMDSPKGPQLYKTKIIPQTTVMTDTQTLEAKVK